MKIKSQIFNIFQKSICKIEHQFENKLKYLYIDFEGKFANKTFEKYTVKEDVK